VKPQLPNNENDQNRVDADGCSVCRELLANLGRFMEMLEAVRDSHRSDWLTVEEIAQELKLSKSIVYRLIRNGELEAVDLVAGDEGKIPQKDTSG
jgi:excisionase family DNA binding protein